LNESLDNYLWLIRLTQELLVEYRFRYGDKTHKCEAHLDWLEHVYPHELKSIGITPPRCAMPPEFKVSDDPVECYRMYYKISKDKDRQIVSYKKRHRPHFLA
jgi:hypothetical protein